MTTALTSEAATLAELSAAGRAESVAKAHVLRLVASWVSRRRAEQAGERGVDLGRYAALEVGTALGMSTGAADTVVAQALQLRDELPRVLAALATGELTWATVRTICDRLREVTDPDVRARAQEQVLGRLVGRDGSRGGVAGVCDRILAAIDPAWVRQRASRALRDRGIEVFAAGDGLAGISGVLAGPDGRLIDEVLDAMCSDPCQLDARTRRQRRADALVALVRGQDRLACTCAHPDCPETPHPEDIPVPDNNPATRTSNTDSTDGAASADSRGDHTADEAVGAVGHAVIPPALRRPVSGPTPRRRVRVPRVVMHVVIPVETLLGAAELPAVLRGFGIIDADTARALGADATWRQLLTYRGTPEHLGRARPAGIIPGTQPRAPYGTLPPREPPPEVDGSDHDTVPCHDTVPWYDVGDLEDLGYLGYLGDVGLRGATGFDQPCPQAPADVLDPTVLIYTPSAAVAELVRDRDGHCRFPACGVPADRCEIDHVVPFDHERPHLGGWTVRTNLGCLCKRHHQAKTDRLWSVRMTPDGTQHWVGPAGQRATTRPSGTPPRTSEHGDVAPAGERPEANPPDPPPTRTVNEEIDLLQGLRISEIDQEHRAAQRRREQRPTQQRPAQQAPAEHDPAADPPPEDDPPPF